MLTGKLGLKRNLVIAWRGGAHEALHLQLFIGELAPNVAERDHRRTVAGQFEQAAEQDRNVVKFRTGALFDLGDHLMCEIGVGTTEIEKKFHPLHHQRSA